MCPNLDMTLKTKLPKQSKDADRKMARTQALLLNAVGPFAHVLKDIVDTVTQFLGNASTSILSDRCCQAGICFNEDLK